MSGNNKINANIRAITYSTLMPITFSPTKTILHKRDSVFSMLTFFFIKTGHRDL